MKWREFTKLSNIDSVVTRGGQGLPKHAPGGTSLWRLGSAIHGSAQFWKASPAPLIRLLSGIPRPISRP